MLSLGLCVDILGVNLWRNLCGIHPSPPFGPSPSSRTRSIMSLPPAQVPSGHCGGRGHHGADPVYLLGPGWGRRWYGSRRVSDHGCSCCIQHSQGCFRLFQDLSENIGGRCETQTCPSGPGFGVLFRTLFITIFSVRAPGSPGRGLLRL